MKGSAIKRLVQQDSSALGGVVFYKDISHAVSIVVKKGVVYECDSQSGHPTVVDDNTDYEDFNCVFKTLTRAPER